MLTSREAILIKVESSYGVDANPTAANDAVLVEEPSWSHEGLRLIERPAIRPSIAMLQQVYAGSLRAVSFTQEIKGSGVLGVPGEISACLRGCGLEEIINADTSVVYKPRNENHESVTIYYHHQNKLNVLTGALGTVSFAVEVGGVTKATYNFIGHSSPQIDAPIPNPQYDAIVPPPNVDAGFSVGGFPAVIANLSLDLGNQLSTPPDLNSEDGFGNVFIVSRDVNGSFDPQDTNVAEVDWEGNFRNNATMPLTTGVIGSDVGNRFQLDLPNIAYRSMGPGDRDGVRTLDMSFGAHEDANGDDFILTMT